MKNILTQNLAKYFLPAGNVQVAEHSFDNGIESVSMLNATRSAIKLIVHFFSPINALASKPVFTVTANSVIVHVFYYQGGPYRANPATKGQTLNNNTVNNLGETLSTLFGRPVELRLIKLHYPYLNSYILAQYIALNTQEYTLVQIIRRIFGSMSPVKGTSDVLAALSSDMPSPTSLGAVVGIKVRLSGRLVTERSRPRQTVQTAQIGTFAKGNMSLVDSAFFTSKNKKGAFTVKVWISQRAVV